MVTTYAKALGVILLALGILGFISAIAPAHMLFGLFLMNVTHNVVFIVSGLILLVAGMNENPELSRNIVLLFGILYGLLAIAGFFAPTSAPVMGMPINRADNVLHLAIAVVSLMIAVPRRYTTMTR